MPITFQEEGRIFHLSTAHTSYLFRVFQNDYLFTLYYGRRLRTCDMTHHWQVYPSGFSPIDQSFTAVSYTHLFASGCFRIASSTTKPAYRTKCRAARHIRD